ncbi:MAG: DNA topoisomerase [Bilifractor sp.]
MKSLYIAEKPSVAQEFGKALHENLSRHDGYLESDQSVVTWCIGHLVTMSYPDQYDESYRRWSFDTLPFLPGKFRYEVIPSVRKQFHIVKQLLNRDDVGTIFVCTDSGREGEYIYRLVAMMSGADHNGKRQKRVWIDSQTEEEIHRGIREAKDLSEYDNLAASAFLRAKEDYLMGINFSRALSIRYAGMISSWMGTKYQAVSVGRVMTCVLGIVVRREREIRHFRKEPFFRVAAELLTGDGVTPGEGKIPALWKVSDESMFAGSRKLYRDNGFKEKSDAAALIRELKKCSPQEAVAEQVSKKTEKKNPPLLYNLAELQNDCSRRFHISPDQTLSVVQELYEKKLVTYPRTDARVLSTAIAKQIDRNIRGLKSYPPASGFSGEILSGDVWKRIGRTRYTDDSKITDHYAIIPTGQGLSALPKLANTSRSVYDLIVRRFLSIFYPAAEYRRITASFRIGRELFTAGDRVLIKEGYLKVAGQSLKKGTVSGKRQEGDGEGSPEEENGPGALPASLRKGDRLPVAGYRIREGKTAPPKRYTSGSMILAMENAGQLIEDEELRSQIRGSGIGTSATRAEILKKLFSIRYLSLNKKTQVITPTQMGEMVFDVVNASIRPLLNPELTASWEKGLTYVAEGSISEEEYMKKLEAFVRRHTENVRLLQNQGELRRAFEETAGYYRKRGDRVRRKSAGGTAGRSGSSA